MAFETVRNTRHLHVMVDISERGLRGWGGGMFGPAPPRVPSGPPCPGVLLVDGALPAIEKRGENLTQNSFRPSGFFSKWHHAGDRWGCAWSHGQERRVLVGAVQGCTDILDILSILRVCLEDVKRGHL